MLRRLAVVVVALAAVLAPVAHAIDAVPDATEGVPHLQHVFTIVLENSNYSASWDPNGLAPYLTTLAGEGAFLPNYYGTGHASADNYIAMTSGQPPTPPFMGDCENYTACVTFERAWPDGGRNITDQIDDAHRSWGAYMESMATPCLHPADTDVIDPYSAPYATRHNPFVYYPTILGGAGGYCAQHVVPYATTTCDDTVNFRRCHGAFKDMLDNDAGVPDYVFITPDTCDDGHDSDSAPVAQLQCKDDRVGGLANVDAWLRANVPPILKYVRDHDGALVITFDENGFTDPNCCTTGGAVGGHIGAIVLSPRVTAGTVSQATYDHYSLLRTVEDAFNIEEHLNLAGLDSHPPINDIWSSPAG